MVQHLARRSWVPTKIEDHVQQLASTAARRQPADVAVFIANRAAASRDIHEARGINLNPASNVMNPKAEAILSAGLGTRASLGYPGDKYEMGLEAIEEIEVEAAELAAKVFNARFAEVRLASGAMANLYAFMATTKPGDAIIAPPPTIGGHVTHHNAGAAGLYGLDIHSAPVDRDGYTVDVEGLAALAKRVRPKLITIGQSLNLAPHPVAAVRAIADEVGAYVLFDAAHLCGLIAGGAWPNPLNDGAHLMTMSTYKSLGGPAGGLLVSNDATLAERIDRIAYPGLTANFDAGRVAALAIALADWVACGKDYAAMMRETAAALATALAAEGLPVFKTRHGNTISHQLAVEAAVYGGGQTAARKLRRAGLLACGIGLPIAPFDGDTNGLRIGTPEICRFGMTPTDMPRLANLISRTLASNHPEDLAGETEALAMEFNRIHFVA